MKRIFLLCLLPGLAFGSCWPGISTVAGLQVGTVPAGVSARYTHWAAWICPDGTKRMTVFALHELLPFSASTTPAAADAACAGACNDVGTSAENLYVRQIQHQAFGAPLMVLRPNLAAYKFRQAADTPSAPVAIGTVKEFTRCTDPIINGYGLVPRAAVTLASKFDTYPLQIYAKCG